MMDTPLVSTGWKMKQKNKEQYIEEGLISDQFGLSIGYYDAFALRSTNLWVYILFGFESFLRILPG